MPDACFTRWDGEGTLLAVEHTSDFPFVAELPRAEPEEGATAWAIAEIKRFWSSSQELGGLVIGSQAKRLLGITDAGVADLGRRGSIRTVTIADVRLYSLADILARIQGYRQKPGPKKGTVPKK